MLWMFLKTRKAWIFFFVMLLAWMNLSFFLDAGFSGVSILYYDGISSILFILFLSWRYFVEVKHLKEMQYFLGNSDTSCLNKWSVKQGLSAFEKKYVEIVLQVLEQKEQQLSDANMRILEESDDLLAWVHEVKSPLTAMKLMLDQVENQKVRERLEKEWLRIYLLVDQQLHNTRLPSIEKDNRMEEVELRKIVVAEIRAIQTWCIEKGIGFEMDKLNHSVVTDQKWLSFIVRQLLTNAVKYSQSTSEIQLCSEVDTMGHVVFHVKDKGIGIQAEDISRIFQKTYTGTAGRESAASSGMGLYLAKNAAEKLGIQISVDSIPGQGSTFTLQFPLENEYVQTLSR